VVVEVLHFFQKIEHCSLLVLDFGAPFGEDHRLQVLSNHITHVVAVVGPVLPESLAKFNDGRYVQIHSLACHIVLPKLKSRRRSKVRFVVSVDGAESVPRAYVFQTSQLLDPFRLFFGRVEVEPRLHLFKKQWVVDLLLSSMVEDIGPLMDWQLSLSATPDLVDESLDSSVDCDPIVVEEKGVLRVVHMVVPLEVPSSLQVVVGVVEPLGLEIRNGLAVPLGVREEPKGCHGQLGAACCLRKHG